MNPQSEIRTPQSLRFQLFISSALLTSALVIVAAWVINSQVIGQVRQQVQSEVETLLPLYDAVWEEHARRLGAIGQTFADSPIVKLVFGDARASRDQRTLHEMLSDGGRYPLNPDDLVFMSDGSGQVFFAEKQNGAAPEVRQIEAARIAGESQKQSTSFTFFNDKLFQLVATPVVLHSESDDFNNTLAVISIAEEVNRKVASEIKTRMHSEVVFLLDGKLYASSLAAENEQAAFNAIQASEIGKAAPERSTEIMLNGETHLVFARQLKDFDGRQVGQVVVLRSLADAGRMFRAISNRLLVLWTLAIVAALGLSYLVAGRITKPLETLVVSAKKLGQGNYDIVVPTGAKGEVAQLATAFDQMRHSLRQTQAALLRNERLATIGQMASSIIHDLRNPLASISAAAEIMLNDTLPIARRQTLVETQIRASGRMNAMLAELLEFSRGSYKLDLSLLSLATVVGRSVQELSLQLSQLGIQVVADVPEDIQLRADNEKLGRVIENLLVNSLQAFQQEGRKSGTVRITARADVDSVRMDLIDDGQGIPDSIRERLFEPFISHGKPGGTGLGLAIARAIIEAHGGKISLADSSNGAHFVIRLPREVVSSGGIDEA